MAYTFGAFGVDEAARTLRRDGMLLSLTPRALDLLVLLLRGRPQAFSKDDLLSALWLDSFVAEGSLSQLVTEVRQVLDDSAREPKYIRTVFKFGYAFCGDAREVGTERGEPSSYFVLWRGQEIPLRRGENILGRDPEARIRLVSTKVSRRHARIVVEPTRAVLSDLGSRNGTYLGERRIAEESVLTDGDHIVIADEVIVFCGSNDPTTTRTGNLLKQN
jgi:DNA-binding winged helix-turn-helix (wHTH) protein